MKELKEKESMQIHYRIAIKKDEVERHIYEAKSIYQSTLDKIEELANLHDKSDPELYVINSLLDKLSNVYKDVNNDGFFQLKNLYRKVNNI